MRGYSFAGLAPRLEQQSVVVLRLRPIGPELDRAAQRTLGFVDLPAVAEDVAEVIECRRVFRVRRDRTPQQIHGAVVVALLGEQESEQVQRDRVTRILVEYPAIDSFSLLRAPGLKLRESGFDLVFDLGARVGLRFGRRRLGLWHRADAPAHRRAEIIGPTATRP